MLYSDVVKFARREIGEIVRYSHDRKKNKISAASQTVATERITSKVYQGQPQHFAHNIQISLKSVYFWRSYSRTREYRSFGP